MHFDMVDGEFSFGCDLPDVGVVLTLEARSIRFKKPDIAVRPQRDRGWLRRITAVRRSFSVTFPEDVILRMPLCRRCPKFLSAPTVCLLSPRARTSRILRKLTIADGPDVPDREFGKPHMVVWTLHYAEGSAPESGMCRASRHLCGEANNCVERPLPNHKSLFSPEAILMAPLWPLGPVKIHIFLPPIINNLAPQDGRFEPTQSVPPSPCSR